LDSFDFLAMPTLNKAMVLELARERLTNGISSFRYQPFKLTK
jgi:hypothetical protein